MLNPFDPRHAGLVASWAATAQEASWWAGAVGFPVSGSTVLAWQADTRAFVLTEQAEPIAYGEIWDDVDESESELAHLIVDPTVRGRGVGLELVRSLMPRAQFDALLMRVHPGNIAAQKCYLKADFAMVDEVRAAEWNAPQPVSYVWLEHARSGR